MHVVQIDDFNLRSCFRAEPFDLANDSSQFFHIGITPTQNQNIQILQRFHRDVG